MAVAVKTSPEAPPRNPVQQLALHSLVGALFLLFSFGLVLGQLPILWEWVEESLGLNRFLSKALLLIVTGGVIVGLFFLGRYLEGPRPEAGLRAGSVLGAIALFVVLLLALWVGNWQVSRGEEVVGMVLSVLLGGALAFGLGWLYLRPAFSRWLVRVEAQGWFQISQFKPTQGLRVRRGTLVALLVLVGCGIYTLVRRETIGSGAWAVPLWGTGRFLHFLFHANFTAPVLILLALGWIAWRIVNWPVFTDFLIATEAEMNKVSWTTRRRLVQDTIVVLVTVFLMAMFLFVVDVIWIKALSSWPIRVLQVDLQSERAKQNAPPASGKAPFTYAPLDLMPTEPTLMVDETPKPMPEGPGPEHAAGGPDRPEAELPDAAAEGHAPEATDAELQPPEAAPSAEPAAPKEDNKKWYVVKVQSGREESIKEAIERRVKIEGLEEFFDQIIIPVERETVMRNGKRVVREKKLFPGYLMAKVEYNDRILYLFRETSGVGDFVGAGVNHPPPPMKDHEVEKMLHKIGKEGPGEIKPTRPRYERGDRVKVKDGVFSGMEGEVKELLEAKGLVRVELTVLGRPVPVELEYWQVEQV